MSRLDPSTRGNDSYHGLDSSSSKSTEQTQFHSLLQECAREALRNALGDVILGILTAQKMLEDPSNANVFTERLKTVFGVSGAKTLEFVITKELFRRLNLPFNPDGSFYYGILLDVARNAISSEERESY